MSGNYFVKSAVRFSQLISHRKMFGELIVKSKASPLEQIRKLEKVVAVDVGSTLHRRWAQRRAVCTQGSPQVWLSRCPKSENSQHFVIQKNVLNFFGIVLGTPENTPETAAAF